MSAVWAFLPALGGAVVHAVVLTFDLMQPLKRPLDGGAAFRGRRVFGDNKTWRGALVIVVGVTATTLLLSQWDWWWGRIPADLRDAGALPYGLLLGIGVVVGELPNSFLKRQLGVRPGASGGLAFTIYDQADFVPAVWLLLLPLWVMKPWQAALAFVVVGGVHLGTNVIGYAIGARRTIV